MRDAAGAKHSEDVQGGGLADAQVGDVAESRSASWVGVWLRCVPEVALRTWLRLTGDEVALRDDEPGTRRTGERHAPAWIEAWRGQRPLLRQLLVTLPSYSSACSPAAIASCSRYRARRRSRPFAPSGATAIAGPVCVVHACVWTQTVDECGRRPL